MIGASSGIGEALARQLSAEGWRLGLLARRLDLLQRLAAELPSETIVRAIDVAEPDQAIAVLERLIADLDGVDLVIVSAGTGHLNAKLDWGRDRRTCDVNVLGFTAMAQSAMRHFFERGAGHLVGITSVGALRGNPDAPAYAASKAFQSLYLDGLRALAKRRKLPITVTEAQPGFVQTAMLKTDRPLPWLVRKLLVASPDRAAQQIMASITKRKKHAYITRRYGPLAFLVKRLPRPG